MELDAFGGMWPGKRSAARSGLATCTVAVTASFTSEGLGASEIRVVRLAVS